MKRAFLRTSDGGRLYYEVRESARRPLLLLRALGGGLEAWHEFRDRLARRRTVSAFDFRGAGESSPVPWGATTRLFARDARELLDALDVRCADVFGASFGGMVATRLALDSASRVSRLVLASTPARGRDVLRGVLRNRNALARCLVKGAGWAEACLAQEVVSPDASDDVRDELEASARALPAPRRELLKQLAAAALHDARGELFRIAQPTLVLIGADDPLLSPARASVVAKAIPGASFEIVSGAGHDLTTEAPQQTAEHVLAFLDAHVGRQQALKQPGMLRQ